MIQEINFHDAQGIVEAAKRWSPVCIIWDSTGISLMTETPSIRLKYTPIFGHDTQQVLEFREGSYLSKADFTRLVKKYGGADLFNQAKTMKLTQTKKMTTEGDEDESQLAPSRKFSRLQCHFQPARRTQRPMSTSQTLL